MNQSALSALRREARDAPDSGIVEVFNYGLGRKGLIPLWAGEGDLPTPQFIADATNRSLAAGETFYTYQRGIPELRAALARYHERQFGRKFSPDRFFITGGGMQAIQIAITATAGTGTEVVVLTPAWPNFAGTAGIAGARPIEVPLDFDGTTWSLDFDRLRAAISPATRSIFVNSPSNPTGWTASEEDLGAILQIAREAGIWIIADEVYNRFVFDGKDRAPSFYDVMEEDDLILFVNTFSKNWAMTGWRIGWISAPPSLGGVIENLIQYSTSGVAAFMQRGAVAALEDGEDFVRLQIERARAGREIVCGGLSSSNRVRFAWPDGAFYLFFTVDGLEETGNLGLRLVDEANLGIAPGTAFGEGGAPFLRLCFLRKAEDLTEATRRLRTWLEAEAALAWRLSRHDLTRVAITLGISTAGGLLATVLGMPAGWVAGGLFAVAVASLAGVNTDFPRPWTAPVFLVLGIYSGTGVTQETINQMQTWPASFAILALSLVLLIAGSYWWLNGRCGWAKNDALLASLPGALSFVVAAAEGLKADMKKVAISQSIRLIILIEAVPLVALLVGHPGSSPTLAGRPIAEATDLAILLIAGTAASLVMNWLRFPGGWILGGLFATAALVLSGAIEVRLPAFLVVPCSIALGAIAGSRFRPGDLAVLPHIAGPALGAFLIAATLSAIAAGAVTLIFGISIVQTLLAFAPGALEGLTVLAYQMNIDPAYVAAHHVVRFVALVIAVPLIARRLARGS